MSSISTTVEIEIRFSETDAMGVVWHGNYIKYFEDAREKMGTAYGMTYMDIYNAGYFVPIVNIEANYKSPISFGQRVKVKAQLIKTKAAKIVYNYQVVDANTGSICCEGKSEQVFVDRKKNELSLNYPEFYEKWMDSISWEE